MAGVGFQGFITGQLWVAPCQRYTHALGEERCRGGRCARAERRIRGRCTLTSAGARVQAVREARPDDEVTAAVAVNNSVAERAADADEAAPRKFFAELGKRMEPLLDKVRVPGTWCPHPSKYLASLASAWYCCPAVIHIECPGGGKLCTTDS